MAWQSAFVVADQDAPLLGGYRQDFGILDAPERNSFSPLEIYFGSMSPHAVNNRRLEIGVGLQKVNH
jgi:hypothetical protein